MLEEISTSFQKNKSLSIVILILLIIGLILININTTLLADMFAKRASYTAHYQNNNLLALRDNYYGTEERVFFGEKDNVVRLKHLYNALRNNEKFQYLITSSQIVNVKDYAGPEKFLFGYDSGDTSHSKKIIDGHNYATINSLQINSTALSAFNLKIIEGTSFSSADYLYHKDKAMPILIGYELKEAYKIGDELAIEYMQIQTKAKVMGILAKDSYILKQGQFIYTDRKIVLPSLEFGTPGSEQEKTIQMRIYLDKVNGTLQTHLSANDVQTEISYFCKQSNLKNFTVIGATNATLAMLGLQLREFIVWTITLSVLILCFAIISLVLALSLKIKKNLRTFAIRMINGATTRDIFLLIKGEIIIYILVANLITALTCLIIGMKYYFISCLITSLMIYISAQIVPHRIIKNTNISELIRRPH